MVSLAVYRTDAGQVTDYALSPLRVGLEAVPAEVRGSESCVQLGAPAWVKTGPAV